MRKLASFALLFSIFAISLSSIAHATAIYSANSTGADLSAFYTNESVYVYADNNVTNNNTAVRIYIVKDGGAPTDGSEISGLFGYRSVNTNTSGHIEIELALVSGAAAGDYDILIDVGNDGRYNASRDHIDSGSAAGFTLKDIPAPSIAFSLGANTSSDHSTNYGDNGNIAMMQMKVNTGSEEDVTISSFDIRAYGTGNDKDGVSVLGVYLDNDLDGKVGTDDKIVSLQKFEKDDIIAVVGLNQIIPANSTKYLVFSYKMSNSTSNGQTYYFEVIAAKVSAASGKTVKSSGLILKSATKTISGSAPEVVCSSYSDSSTCGLQSSCSWCSVNSTCKKSSESCVVANCTGTLSFDLVQTGSVVSADFKGLSDCGGKSIYLKEASCDGTNVNSCSVTGTGCSLMFTAPSSSKNYFGCVDENGDGTFDQAEQSSKLFVISSVKSEEGSDIVSFITSNYILLGGIIFAVVIIAIFIVKSRKKPNMNNETIGQAAN